MSNAIHRKVLNSLLERLNIQTYTNCFSITRKDLIKNGLISASDDKTTTVDIFRSAYPEFDWYPWNFHISAGFWKSISHQRQFCDWIAKELNIDTLNGWYNLSCYEIRRLGGKTLIDGVYNTNCFELLKKVYPEFRWYPWLFKKSSQNIWDSIDTRTSYFNWLFEELELETQEDWYRVTFEDIRALEGRTMLNTFYHGKVVTALESLYPMFEWHPWKRKVHRHFWTLEQQKKCFDAFAEDVGIKEQVDWYEHKNTILSEKGVGTIIEFFYNSSLLKALSAIYPEFQWEPLWMSEGQSKVVKLLEKSLSTNHNIISNHKIRLSSLQLQQKHSDCELQVDNCGDRLSSLQHLDCKEIELDVYIPSLNLAIEYQGDQHYKDINKYFALDVNRQQFRDELKKQICNQLGISLISIPFWWDNNLPSLKATLQRVRPDISFNAD